MATVTTRYRCPVSDECPPSQRRGFCPNHVWEQLVPERIYLTAVLADTADAPVAAGATDVTDPAGAAGQAAAPAEPEARAEAPRRVPATPAPATSQPALTATQLALVLLGALVPVCAADRGRTVLGRDAADCAHVPGLTELDQVSRLHAELHWHGGRLYVTDLGSSNGTFVDGERISRPTQLWPGAHRLQLAQHPEAVDVAVIELDEFGAPS
jgi:hypothetical protein